MKNYEKIIVMLSKEVMKRYHNGELELSAGGARDKATGQFVELYKLLPPESAKKAINIAPGAQTVIGLVNTAQMCYMQKGINEINKKTDMILNATNMLKKMSVINMMVSLANVGVSAIGFMTLYKSLEADKTINLATYNIIKKFANDKLVDDYTNHMSKMQHYFSKLQEDFVDDDHISMELMECRTFFLGLEEESRFDYLKGGLEWCKMIISFSSMYTHLVGFYASTYERTYGKKCKDLELWLDPIVGLNSETVKNRLLKIIEDYCYFERPDLSPQQIALAINAVKLIPYRFSEIFKEIYSIGLKQSVQEWDHHMININHQVKEALENMQTEKEASFDDMLYIPIQL